jgi:prepilin-type N-terminal cleavage/methylation domain-containing protein
MKAMRMKAMRMKAMCMKGRRSAFCSRRDPAVAREPTVIHAPATVEPLKPRAASRVRRCPLRRLAEFAGFTLVELLVVLAILAVVMALLIPFVSRLRESSARAQELSAVRMLMSAWQMYAHDSQGALLPGYRSGLSAYDANRGTIASQTIGITANRWVWRLAPYIGHDFNALYVGQHERMLRELERTDYSNYLYQTSVFPSFGLNSVWVGGDENFGGYNSAFLNLYGKFYVTRLGEIDRPAGLVVFASARGQDSMPTGEMSDVTEGYFRIRSPSFNTRIWASSYGDDPASYGNLSARNGGVVATGFADGHVEAREPTTLDDMRLWSNGATASDWTLTPGG